jgi:four helix bundle protein
VREQVAEDRFVRSYRDLWVWKEGMELAEMCYRLTRAFPREEVFGMTSQVRRAATAIPDNIAEGYGRENSGEYVQFLRIAQGSLKELETHLILASRVGLASNEDTASILEKCETVGKMLRALIRSIQKRQKTKSRK